MRPETVRSVVQGTAPCLFALRELTFGIEATFLGPLGGLSGPPGPLHVQPFGHAVDEPLGDQLSVPSLRTLLIGDDAKLWS